MSGLLIKPLVLACLAVAAAQAGAATVVFTGFTNGAENAHFATSAPNVPTSGDAGAGGLATELNGGPTFASYCVDLYQSISFNTAYTDYSLVPGAAHAFANANANVDIGRLYSEGHALNNGIDQAAFQIAIWEIAFERTGNAYDITTGSAQFSKRWRWPRPGSTRCPARSTSSTSRYSKAWAIRTSCSPRPPCRNLRPTP